MLAKSSSKVSIHPLCYISKHAVSTGWAALNYAGTKSRQNYVVKDTQKVLALAPLKKKKMYCNQQLPKTWTK